MPANPNDVSPQVPVSIEASLAAINVVPVGAPLRWLELGLADLQAAPRASLFYGIAFAVMGWAIVFFYGNAYSLTVALIGGFMLLGPGLAMGLYALSRQREAGEVPRLGPTLTIWRANLSNLGIFALVTGVVFLIWARASMVAAGVGVAQLALAAASRSTAVVPTRGPTTSATPAPPTSIPTGTPT